MAKMDIDIGQLENARRRLQEAHRSSPGGWRDVAEQVGVNVRYVHQFARYGLIPESEPVTEKLLTWEPNATGRAMSGEMAVVLGIIQRHVGLENAIKKRDLLREIWGEGAAADESYNNPYDRKLRAYVEQINHDHGGLICSSNTRGYFWASGLRDGLDAVEAGSRRARTVLDNAGHLKRNIIHAFGGQAKLFD